MCHRPFPPYIPEPHFYLTRAGKVVMENKLQLWPHLAFLRQVKFCKIQQTTASWIGSQTCPETQPSCAFSPQTLPF